MFHNSLWAQSGLIVMVAIGLSSAFIGCHLCVAFEKSISCLILAFCTMSSLGFPSPSLLVLLRLAPFLCSLWWGLLQDSMPETLVTSLTSHFIQCRQLPPVWMGLSSWFLAPVFLPKSRPALMLPSQYLHLVLTNIFNLTNQNVTYPFFSSLLFLIYYLFMSMQTSSDPPVLLVTLVTVMLLLSAYYDAGLGPSPRVIFFSSLCLLKRYTASYLCLNRREFFLSNFFKSLCDLKSPLFTIDD